jgi:hypothetical protein
VPGPGDDDENPSLQSICGLCNVPAPQNLSPGDAVSWIVVLSEWIAVVVSLFFFVSFSLRFFVFFSLFS